MTKRVIIIASGETERRSLPHLLGHLEAVTVAEVRIPPSQKALKAQMMENLINAAWYEHLNCPPDKFVLVIDLDGAEPEKTLAPFQKRIKGLRNRIGADILCAYAQQHLEAWYFADAENLRLCLGRALGHIDASKPDEIQNPKLHLKKLLAERFYNARVSEGIAKRLDSRTIAGRSPSFRKFVEAIMNGGLNDETDHS